MVIGVLSHHSPANLAGTFARQSTTSPGNTVQKKEVLELHRDESNTFGFDVWIQPPSMKVNPVTPKEEFTKEVEKKKEQKGMLKKEDKREKEKKEVKANGIEDSDDDLSDRSDESEVTSEEGVHKQFRRKSGSYPHDARGRRLPMRRVPNWP